MVDVADDSMCGSVRRSMCPTQIGVSASHAAVAPTAAQGLALLRETKARHPELPVMMVTAYGDDDRRRQAADDGALLFLSKPVDFDFLKQQLRQLPTAPAY